MRSFISASTIVDPAMCWHLEYAVRRWPALHMTVDDIRGLPSAALVSGKPRTDEGTTVCLLWTLLAIVCLIRPLAGINNAEVILFVFILFVGGGG